MDGIGGTITATRRLFFAQTIQIEVCGPGRCLPALLAGAVPSHVVLYHRGRHRRTSPRSSGCSLGAGTHASTFRGGGRPTWWRLTAGRKPSKRTLGRTSVTPFQKAHRPPTTSWISPPKKLTICKYLPTQREPRRPRTRAFQSEIYA
jgi:hypothetical protein